MPERVKIVEVQRSYPAREGRKATSVYLPNDVHYTLSLLALNEGSSLQKLGEEAFMLLLEKRGARIRKPPAAAE